MARKSLERALLAVAMAGGLFLTAGCKTTEERPTATGTEQQGTPGETDTGTGTGTGTETDPGTGGTGMEEQPPYGEPERQKPDMGEEGTGGAGTEDVGPIEEPGGLGQPSDEPGTTGETPDTPVNPDEQPL